MTESCLYFGVVWGAWSQHVGTPIRAQVLVVTTFWPTPGCDLDGCYILRDDPTTVSSTRPGDHVRVNQSRWNPEPLEPAEKGPGDRFWRPKQNLESFAGVAGRSEIEFSLTTPPPGRSEGPGPLRRKQKRVLFSVVTRPLQSLPYMDNKSSGKTPGGNAKFVISPRPAV